MESLLRFIQKNPIAVLSVFILNLIGTTVSIISGWNSVNGITVPLWFYGLSVIVLLLAYFLKPKKKELETVQGVDFGIETVLADGKRFVNCRFVGSRILIEAREPFEFTGNHFNNVSWSFGAEASYSLLILAELYKTPELKPMIEKLFDDVRNDSIPESRGRRPKS